MKEQKKNKGMSLLWFGLVMWGGGGGGGVDESWWESGDEQMCFLGEVSRFGEGC